MSSTTGVAIDHWAGHFILSKKQVKFINDY